MNVERIEILIVTTKVERKRREKKINEIKTTAKTNVLWVWMLLYGLSSVHHFSLNVIYVCGFLSRLHRPIYAIFSSFTIYIYSLVSSYDLVSFV